MLELLHTPEHTGVFITDVHLTSGSNVRVDEDYPGTILNKLKYCIDKANEWDCPLFIGGDFTDKPTLPDVVKNRLIPILQKCNHPIISVYGNHSRLYNSIENNPKTSMYLFDMLGLIHTYDTGGIRWLDGDKNEVYINFTRPMGKHGLPQLGIYHGFLNTDSDKDNMFLFQDIDHNDESLIFLGHDHVPYEPVEYSNSTIVRPGSLVRAIRADTETRIPQLVRFKYSQTQQRWVFKNYPIPCASPELCFKTKRVKVEKRDEDTYASIIEQIRNSSSDELGFIEALSKVSPLQVVDYCENILHELENRKANK